MATPQETFSITPAVPQAETLLPPLYEEKRVVPSSEVLRHRAEKASFGLENKVSAEELELSMATGDEQRVRQQVARTRDVEQINLRQSMTKSFMETFEGEPTSDDLSFVVNMQQHTSNDPDTIFEKEYARQFVNTALALDDEGSSFDKALIEDEDETLETVSLSQDIITQKEIAQSLIEDIEAERQQQTRTRRTEDFIETFIPGYSWIMQSNAVDDPAVAESLLPGNNKQEQYDYLLSLPPEQMRKEAKAAIDRIKEWNYDEAVSFAQGLAGYSVSEQFITNAFGVADALTTVPLGGVVKGVVKGAKVAGRTVSGARTAARVDEATGIAEEKLKAVVELPSGKGKMTVETNSPQATAKAAAQLKKGLEPTSIEVAEAALIKGNKVRLTNIPPVYEVHAPIRTRKDGSNVNAWFNRDTNSIYINKSGLTKNFEEKAWTKPKVEGVRPLPEDQFKTPDEYIDFVVRHEQIHASFPRLKGETNAAYENRINVMALKDKSDFIVDTPKTTGLSPTTPSPSVLPPNASNYDKAKELVLNEGKASTSFIQRKLQISYNEAARVVSKLEEDGIVSPPDHIGKRTVTAPKTNASPAVTEFKKEVIKPLVQSAGRRTTKPEEVLASVGKTVEATNVYVMRKINNFLKGRDPDRKGKTLFEEATSILDPQAYLRGPFRIAQQQANEMVQRLQVNGEKLLQSLSDPNTLNRLSKNAEEAAIEETRRVLRNTLTHVSDAILDVVPDSVVRSSDDLSNVTTASIQMGRKDKSLFDDADEAFKAAEMEYGLTKKQYSVKRLGDKYYINISKPIDETSVRGLLIDNETATPKSLVNNFLGWLRTPEDTLSQLQRDNRHAFTHATTEVARLVGETAKSIGKLSNREKKHLDRLLQSNRDEFRTVINPKTGKEEEVRGMYHQTLGEFEQGYHAVNGEYPTAKEAEAYFSAIQLNDIDYIVRNLSLYRDKARQGIENYEITIRTDDPDFPHMNTKFEGKEVDALPDMAEDAGVALYDEATKQWTYFRKNTPVQTDYDLVKKKLEEGYKIVQVANPVDKPLKKLNGSEETVNFVIVKAPVRSPLMWKQIPYKPGGHVAYAGEFFVKQGKFRKTSYGRTVYEGDQSMLSFTTEAEAKKFAPRLDTARRMIKNNDAGADDYIRKNLPWKPKEFRSFFEDSINPITGEVVKRAKLSLNDRIDYVQNQQGMNDKFRDQIREQYPDFDDTIDSAYNLYRNIDKKFTGERDPNLPTIHEYGDNTELKLEPPRLIDPLTTMQRSTANIVKNRHMADYIHSSIENWVAEFSDLMRVDAGENNWNNAMARFYEPRWMETVDRDKLGAAINSRRAILHLIGEPSKLAKEIQHVQNKIMDSVFNRFGHKKSDWIADHIIPGIADPFRFVRATAFHSKLGLFNPVQMFVQAQSLTHAMAIAPQHAWHGLSAAFFMRRMKMRPGDDNLANHVAGLASRLGWNKDEFLESWNELKKTGLMNVEGDTALLDDISPPKTFSSGTASRVAGQVLDAGTVFFKETERMIRLNAWNIAFREFKRANPNIKIGSRERNTILTRADLLSVNMTRASNASWQKGIAAVPTQFFAYQARLSEQLLGKRLTGPEALRVMGLNSFLYGVPTAFGAVTAVWPWQESFRQAAFESNVDMDDKVFEAFSDGVPAMLVEALTGYDPAYAERMGPGGLKIFKEIASGEASLTDVLFGASGSILGAMAESAEPAFAVAASLFREHDEKYPFMVQDYIDAARHISTVNNAYVAWYALQAGLYITKNDMEVAELGGVEGVIAAITGMAPQQINDAFLMVRSNKELADIQRASTKQIEKYFTRAIEATNEADREKNLRAARAHLRLGAFRPSQYDDILRQITGGHGQTLYDNVWKEFHIDKAPHQSSDQRLERFLSTEEK